jgi:hypothetical protein
VIVNIAVVSLVAVSPARALFFPGVQQLSREEGIQQEEGSWSKYLSEGFERTVRTPVGGLALSFDYRYNVQDLCDQIPTLGASTSESEVNTYSIRPELVVANWLSLYGIFAQHDGTNRPTKYTFLPDVDLDGWATGMGVTAALGLPPTRPSWWDFGTIDPLFIVPDFNWTHNEFDGIENAVDVYNVTTRIGFGARTNEINWAVYGGPQFQRPTRSLTVNGNAVTSEPEDAWSGVVGALFGVRIAKDPRDLKRPTLLATVEGGVGNRHGVMFSLRYEYDLLSKLM